MQGWANRHYAKRHTVWSKINTFERNSFVWINFFKIIKIGVCSSPISHDVFEILKFVWCVIRTLHTSQWHDLLGNQEYRWDYSIKSLGTWFSGTVSSNFVSTRKIKWPTVLGK